MALKLGSRPESRSEEEQVRATRKRFLRRQRARRWMVWRRLLVLVAILGAVSGSIWLIFFSSVLSVQGAEVTGVEVLSIAEVQKAAQIPEGVPLATADLGAIEARVEALAPVRGADVSRSWPDKVRIEVTERVAVAAVQRDGRWGGLDDQGVLFRSYPGRPEGLPEVRMRAGTSVDALAEAAAVVDALPGDIRSRVGYLDVRTIDAISFRLKSGALVNWGSAEESAAKAVVLAALLEQEASVYDVTAPGRPTLKP